MRLNKVKLTKENFAFYEKFGWFGIEESTGAYSYFSEKTERCFKIESSISTKQLAELITKSLADNHDYVFDLVGKKENEIVYKEGLIY